MSDIGYILTRKIITGISNIHAYEAAGKSKFQTKKRIFELKRIILHIHTNIINFLSQTFRLSLTLSRVNHSTNCNEIWYPYTLIVEKGHRRNINTFYRYNQHIRGRSRAQQ